MITTVKVAEHSRIEAPEMKTNFNIKAFLVFMNLKGKQCNRKRLQELIMRQKHRKDKSWGYKSGGAT